VGFEPTYIIKLCRQQAEVIQNHVNANVCDIGKGKMYNILGIDENGKKYWIFIWLNVFSSA
jgi:hypothetical protein